MSRRTWPLALYAALTPLFLPAALRRSRERMRIAGIPAGRVRELTGQSPHDRPRGRLLWCHAASVGESLSVLPLLDKILGHHPDLTVLLTTGTPTSAQALRGRLPERCLHQFAPLDSRRPVRRFLAHWQPDAAVFVESELWPNMLMEASGAHIPMALINARLSQRSLRRWHWARGSFGVLMSCFERIFCADAATHNGLKALGIAPARLTDMPPLKRLTSPAAPSDEVATTHALAAHPVWLAASTHPGEEEIVLTAHEIMRRTHPDLRLIHAPRHPERARDIAGLIVRHGLTVSQRSLGQAPDSAVYLADTVGEMEIWLGLARFAFIGGSLVPHGGHNPYEALRAGVPVLTGPYRESFAADYTALLAAGAGREVGDASELAAAGLSWLDDPARHARAAEAARAAGRPDPAVLTEIAARLSAALRL